MSALSATPSDSQIVSDQSQLAETTAPMAASPSSSSVSSADDDASVASAPSTTGTAVTSDVGVDAKSVVELAEAYRAPAITQGAVVDEKPVDDAIESVKAPASDSEACSTETIECGVRQYVWAYGPDKPFKLVGLGLKAKALKEYKLVDGSDAANAFLKKAGIDVQMKILESIEVQYPPHADLRYLPKSDSKFMDDIFDKDVLGSVREALRGSTELYFRLPHKDEIKGDWSLKDAATANRRMYEQCKAEQAAHTCKDRLNPLLKNNIADRADWYSDAAFAQQQLTGPNPTTICVASAVWIKRFLPAAREQVPGAAQLLEADPLSFYVQDNSYFRAAMRLNAADELSSPPTPLKPKAAHKYACASVSLFRLEENGMLHPIAIVIDYKGDMASSVTIVNRRFRSTDTTMFEETDWPWRYAKMCAQSSDWLRHEVTIHLTNTHLVEEAVIVSARRTLPPTHVVFKLLSDHWTTTLSVNTGARDTLVPLVIAPLAGVKLKELTTFLNHAYETFDWTGLYVPNDLAKRGFPPGALEHDPKFRNYAYGRNMALMWPTIRKFVASVVSEEYKGRDSLVRADADLAAFCAEMRVSARIASFPEVKTLDELIDMVTMCIHIAAPQHTAVNYLQHYYQVFVPNKPASLYRPLPKTLNELLQYREKHITDSLPGPEHLNDWQVMALLPYMLSEEVKGDQTFLKFAENLAEGRVEGLKYAGGELYRDLKHLQQVFKDHNEQLKVQHPSSRYKVMDPEFTANSILI